MHPLGERFQILLWPRWLCRQQAVCSGFSPSQIPLAEALGGHRDEPSMWHRVGVDEGPSGAAPHSQGPPGGHGLVASDLGSCLAACSVEKTAGEAEAEGRLFGLISAALLLPLGPASLVATL